MAIVACQLIPLDKKPVVQLFQVELLQKPSFTFYVIRTGIQLAASALQTCDGHDAEAEAAIHAMRNIFAGSNTDAVLLVDASCFNQVNHQCALHNISMLCPSFATILKNTYGVPIRLFMTFGEGEIASTEGTTQGDSLAMALYALAVQWRRMVGARGAGPPQLSNKGAEPLQQSLALTSQLDHVTKIISSMKNTL